MAAAHDPHPDPVLHPNGVRNGGVLFQLFAPIATDWLNSVRTVGVLWDGARARFTSEGTVQAFEEVDQYKARTIKDRFTSEMLERYCQAMGIDVFNASAYGRSVLVTSDVVINATSRQGTIEDAQQFLGIVPGRAPFMD